MLQKTLELAKHIFKQMNFLRVILVINILWSTAIFAGNPVVNLVVAYKTVNFAGKNVRAIAVNDQIPAPTLHFKQGDHVIINVYNHLDQPTSLHWHGILLPWQMDGVSWVTQKPIPPGGVFHYHFTLRQSGTYWYHSHFGLQEQQGLYGAFIIDPPHEHMYYTKDFVVVLSDWSNTRPEQILANLKKSGDFYETQFPLQASLVQYLKSYREAKTPEERKQINNIYFMMQKMRMSPYDINDVAYDTFLLNGQSPMSPWRGLVKPGDIVRLRFIGAGASTIFRVKIPETKMQVVHVQGWDVKPFYTDNFSIAPGETYDVLVKITKPIPYIIYAEATDKVGAAYGALVENPHQSVAFNQVEPFPDPPPQMMMPMNANHGMAMNMPMGMPMKMSMPMSMASTPTQHTMMMQGAIQTKYQHEQALYKSNDPNIKPYKTLRFVLSGYMDKFIWFINGVPEYRAKPILVEPGKRYRFIFINNSMMHHPMHLHGHWFVLRTGHGAYDPKIHTIDVPPGATVTADVDTDEQDGQWYFHCHNLYHMKAGMANIVRYENTPAYQYQDLPGHHYAEWFASNNLDLAGDFFNNIYQATYVGLFGPDYDKLQLKMKEAEMDDGALNNADLDIFYWHLISQFWAIKGGANYVYRPAHTPYWQPGVGIEGTMPFFIETDLRAYLHDGSVKFDLELTRNTHIDRKFFIGTSIRAITATKTITEDEIGSGINEMEYSVRPFYQLTPNIAPYFEYEYTQYLGPLRNIRKANGEGTSENAYFLGVSLLF